MKKTFATEKKVIIFDIDSASVAAGFFAYGFDAAGELLHVRELFSLRKSITTGQKYSFGDFWRRAQMVLDEVAREVHIQSLTGIDELYCNVGAPWVSAQIRELVYQKKKDFLLTPELVNSIVAEDQKHDMVKNLDYTEHRVGLIDYQLLDFCANGYSVRRPYAGHTMSDLKITSLASVMSQDTKKQFEHIIERHFHRIPKMTSNIFISYDEVRRCVAYLDNAVICDISGETSELINYVHDQIKHVGVIPAGIHHVLRGLADLRDVSVSQAQTLFELYHSGSLASLDEQRLVSDLRSAFNAWLLPFYDMIDEMSRDGLLTPVLVLKIDKKYRSLFEYLLLERDELREHMHTRGAISIVDIENLRIVNKREYIDINDSELGIIAEALGVHFLDGASEKK